MSVVSKAALAKLTNSYVQYQSVWELIIKKLRYQRGSVKEGEDYNAIMADYFDKSDNACLGISFRKQKKEVMDSLDELRRFELADEFEQMHGELEESVGKFLRGHVSFGDFERFHKGQHEAMESLLEAAAEPPKPKKKKQVDEATVFWGDEEPAEEPVIEWERRKRRKIIQDAIKDSSDILVVEPAKEAGSAIFEAEKKPRRRRRIRRVKKP